MNDPVLRRIREVGEHNQRVINICGILAVVLCVGGFILAAMFDQPLYLLIQLVGILTIGFGPAFFRKPYL